MPGPPKSKRGAGRLPQPHKRLPLSDPRILLHEQSDTQIFAMLRHQRSLVGETNGRIGLCLGQTELRQDQPCRKARSEHLHSVFNVARQVRSGPIIAGIVQPG